MRRRSCKDAQAKVFFQRDAEIKLGPDPKIHPREPDKQNFSVSVVLPSINVLCQAFVY